MLTPATTRDFAVPAFLSAKATVRLFKSTEKSSPLMTLPDNVGVPVFSRVAVVVPSYTLLSAPTPVIVSTLGVMSAVALKIG